MNKLFKALLASALLSSTMMSSVAYAEQKIGVINRQAVIQQMPQAIAMQQSLQIELKDEGAKIDAMRQQMATDLEKLRKDAPTMSEAQIKAEQERLQKKNAEYETLAKPFQEKVKARQQEENIKVIQLLNSAIQQVVDEEKFDLVLDAQAIVYATPAHNISEKVLKKVSGMK